MDNGRASSESECNEESARRVVGKNKMVKESMRLRAAGGINFVEPSKAINVQGFHVPAKAAVFLNTWSIQRNSKYWERPDKFIPERFSNVVVDYGGHDFNFTPFGLGHRICSRKSFALITVQSTIANLLYWFDWNTVGGEKLNMLEAFESSVRLKMPVDLVAVPHFS